MEIETNLEGLERALGQEFFYYLNEPAMAKGYFSLSSACGYATAYDPEWRKEGEIFTKFRDESLRAYYNLVNKCKKEGYMPLFKDVLKILPEQPTFETEEEVHLEAA